MRVLAVLATPALTVPAHAEPTTVEFCGGQLDPNATVVECEQAEVTVDLALLAKLPGLRSLRLRGIAVGSWASLEKLVTLEELHLIEAPITDVAFVKRLPALRVL